MDRDDRGWPTPRGEHDDREGDAREPIGHAVEAGEGAQEAGREERHRERERARRQQHRETSTNDRADRRPEQPLPRDAPRRGEGRLHDHESRHSCPVWCREPDKAGDLLRGDGRDGRPQDVQVRRGDG